MFVIGLESTCPLCAPRGAMYLALAYYRLSPSCWLPLALLLVNPVPSFWKMSWQTAPGNFHAIAMSSTAIVVKLQPAWLELESEHGKRVMGALLFQDLWPWCPCWC
jgi:CPA2 family monovalent cation:H+ antiporter-2